MLVVSAILNDAAVVALNSARGSTFSVGLQLDTAAPPEQNPTLDFGAIGTMRSNHLILSLK